MQMSRSLLPKPAAAPAHSNSVPGLVLCLGGSSASGSDSSIALGGGAAWALRAGKTTAYQEHTSIYSWVNSRWAFPHGRGPTWSVCQLVSWWSGVPAVAGQWPLLLATGWSSPGLETHTLAPSHSHPLYLPKLCRQC